jgi:dynein heavy chain
MKLFAEIVFVFVLPAVLVKAQNPIRLNPVIVNETTTPGSCPAAIGMARLETAEAIDQFFIDAPCGGLGWYQIASLDMSDSRQQCPSPWVVTGLPVRTCTSPPGGNNCVMGAIFPAPGNYTRVCGRIFGYSLNTPDAFFHEAETIDSPYLDGVSVTVGSPRSPRQHIWSLGVGHGDEFGVENIRCPCGNTDRVVAPLPPPFVGDNYFCDNLDNMGELWDASGCASDNTCCLFNNPPYFNATLPAPTTDGVEVRMCHDQNSQDETVHIRLLELYVQ